MGREEIEKLKEQLLEVDISANNPAVQQAIEKGLADWVETYVQNNAGKFSADDIKKYIPFYREHSKLDRSKDVESQVCTVGNVYNREGSIPDEVEFNDSTYSPVEIYEHVKARNKVGIAVLERIVEIREENPMFNKMNERVAKELDKLKDDEELDKVIFEYLGSGPERTLRDVCEKIIEGYPKAMMLEVGIPDAIVKFQGHTPWYEQDQYRERAEEKGEAQLGG